jgi:hypothetical protein
MKTKQKTFIEIISVLIFFANICFAVHYENWNAMLGWVSALSAQLYIILFTIEKD